MSRPRRILAVTGSRADFGILLPVLRAIRQHPRLRLYLVATGLHLTMGTWRDIRDQSFPVAAKLPMQSPRHAGRLADVQALARGIAGLGPLLARLQPNVVLVLGDRIEVLAAACTAHIGGFHLAHIHGGDRAEGVADESIRHAVSKLAHIHFAATSASRRRLIRMGESPRLVFNVGSPAIDDLRSVQPATDAPDILVLQHPVGASDAQEKRWMLATLRATAGFRRLILAPNSDPGCDGIWKALKDVDEPVLTHIPRMRFLSLLAGAKALVGNSSAGLIEATALGLPCVNIGPRQAGRQRCANVIDCDYGTNNVRRALRRALAMGRRKVNHPYGDGRAGWRIARILALINLSSISLRKRNTY